MQKYLLIISFFLSSTVPRVCAANLRINEETLETSPEKETDQVPDEATGKKVSENIANGISAQMTSAIEKMGDFFSGLISEKFADAKSLVSNVEQKLEQEAKNLVEKEKTKEEQAINFQKEEDPLAEKSKKLDLE